MSIIVFDTETTAPEPGQICQLAYLLIDGPRVTGRNLFFAVDGMTERAFRVHGLSRERLETLSGGRRFSPRGSRWRGGARWSPWGRRPACATNRRCVATCARRTSA